MAARSEGQLPNLGELLKRLQGWLRDDGELVLSLSNAAEPGDLLGGWDVVEQRSFVCRSSGTWEPAPATGTPTADETVLLFRLRPAS
jgi:hypothetical protein